MQLALKLHPDKNTAPGADDAFKGNFGALDIIRIQTRIAFRQLLVPPMESSVMVTSVLITIRCPNLVAL